jgi:hypothetical protein
MFWPYVAMLWRSQTEEYNNGRFCYGCAYMESKINVHNYSSYKYLKFRLITNIFIRMFDIFCQYLSVALLPGESSLCCQ